MPPPRVTTIGSFTSRSAAGVIVTWSVPLAPSVRSSDAAPNVAVSRCCGVARTVCEAAPFPLGFTARTWNAYSVRLARLPTVYATVPASLGLMAVQPSQLTVGFPVPFLTSQRVTLRGPCGQESPIEPGAGVAVTVGFNGAG